MDRSKEILPEAGRKARDGHEYRLPTEAEWEYGCRGGASSKDSVPFYLKSGPTSSLSGGQINFDGNSPYGDGVKGKYLERTGACGSFAESVNAFGLCDMHGNVWEWCEDWYGDYPKERVKDPTGPGEGSDRVIRGGCWSGSGQGCRAAPASGTRRPAGTRTSASGLPEFPSGSRQESRTAAEPGAEAGGRSRGAGGSRSGDGACPLASAGRRRCSRQRGRGSRGRSPLIENRFLLCTDV